MPRKINHEFLNEFLEGSLNPLLKYIRLDDTLNMELRGESVIIYYRGGAILTILEDKYKFLPLAKEYHKHTEIISPTIKNFNEFIPAAKHILDVYINSVRNHLGEKDIQQQIARENNFSPNSLDTDFFVIDTEYQDQVGRFDIVALRWDSTGAKRKLPDSYLPTITIFEVKQGYGAIAGKSGMVDHITGFNKFLSEGNLKAFKEDMLKVFDQKRKLGLIKGCEKYKAVQTVAHEIDFVFLLVNYKHDSKQLEKALKEIDDCKFIYANSMGYGLYARNILGKKQYEKMFMQNNGYEN